jgi:hypothetical protein
MTQVADHFATDTVEKEKAVVRRLQAALAPSIFPMAARPTDRAIVDQLAAILTSDGVKNLLATGCDDRFAVVICRARDTVDAGGSDREVIERLWEFMDVADLNDALATSDRNEAPQHLVKLMYQGPYRGCAERPPK